MKNFPQLINFLENGGNLLPDSRINNQAGL
jgi:hypothetical protein